MHRPSSCSPAASKSIRRADEHELSVDLPHSLDTQQLQSAQVASADSISKNLSPLLRDCTKNGFVIVSQPGVSPSDFVAHQSTPHLERWLSGTDKKTKTVIEISNVVGPVIKDKKRFASVQERYCQTNEEWSSMTLDGTGVSILRASVVRTSSSNLNTQTAKFLFWETSLIPSLSISMHPQQEERSGCQLFQDTVCRHRTCS